MALNHSIEILSYYLYLLGALQRILSPRRKSRIFEYAILKISQYSTMWKFDDRGNVGQV